MRGRARACARAFGSLGGDWGYLGPMVAGSVVATAIYAGLFVPLGYLTERATIVGLLFVLVWEGAVAAIPSLAATSPVRLGYAAYVSLAPSTIMAGLGDASEYVLGDISPSAGTAVIQVAVVLAVSAAFLTWLLRTRDLA